MLWATVSHPDVTAFAWAPQYMGVSVAAALLELGLLLMLGLMRAGLAAVAMANPLAERDRDAISLVGRLSVIKARRNSGFPGWFGVVRNDGRAGDGC